jgi:hypothetical protein
LGLIFLKKILNSVFVRVKMLNKIKEGLISFKEISSEETPE